MLFLNPTYLMYMLPAMILMMAVQGYVELCI